MKSFSLLPTCLRSRERTKRHRLEICFTYQTFGGWNAKRRCQRGSAMDTCHVSPLLWLSDSPFSSPHLAPCPVSPSSCLLPLLIKCQNMKAARGTESCLTFTCLPVSLPLSFRIPLSAQFPESGDLGETHGLSEDHSACLCASVWPLVVGLALALVLAQHAL